MKMNEICSGSSRRLTDDFLLVFKRALVSSRQAVNSANALHRKNKEEQQGEKRRKREEKKGSKLRISWRHPKREVELRGWLYARSLNCFYL
jgi:hypothetical protein